MSTAPSPMRSFVEGIESVLYATAVRERVHLREALPGVTQFLWEWDCHQRTVNYLRGYHGCFARAVLRSVIAHPENPVLDLLRVAGHVAVLHALTASGGMHEADALHIERDIWPTR